MTNEKIQYTTIRVSIRNCDRIKKYGAMGDNMDQVIEKVLSKIEG